MTAFFSGAFSPKPKNSAKDGDGGDDNEPPVPSAPSFNFKHPLVITVAVIVAIGVFIYVMSQVWTEILWFNQLEVSRVFWTKWIAAILLGLVGFLVTFAALAACVQWAYRKRPLLGGRAANMRAYQRGVEPFRKLLFWGGPALFALIMAVSLASNWQQVLMWINRVPFGEVDPQFGLDLGFYIFTVPTLEIILSFVTSVAVVSLITVIAVNYLYGGIIFSPRPSATKSARLQMGLLAALLSLLFGLRYWLSIYSMLYKQNAEPVDGALYRDINAGLPAQAILAVVSVLVAFLFLYASFRGAWRLPAAGVAVTVVSALVIGMAYPALIQQFRVAPNARQLERPYIQRNIDATLTAFGLDDVEYQTYSAKTDVSPGQLRDDSDSTSQIRLLDPNIVSPTFRQLQQSRPYYTFSSQLSVDRYTIGGEQRDTVIAVRDLNLRGLQPEQQTWVNMHTVYTHGFGVVAAYGSTVNANGTPAFWEQSIPSQGELGDYEERVYFSPNAPEYSIVGAPEGAAPQELDYPDDNADSGQVQSTFKGNAGPSVGNVWNKLLYAVKFGSTDIFFSDQTNPESQILYNRDPIERAKQVAPFLTLEQTAYPAVVSMNDSADEQQSLVWIIDGYTTSNSYPYAEHVSWLEATTDSRTTATGDVIQEDSVNYIRNSVKIVVNAYDGSVTLYEWDSEDPILQAWKGVYPGLIQDTSEISGSLMSHLRYPQDMFKVQRSLLTTYHVTEASEFYTGGDRWRLSEDPTTGEGASQVVQAPYYLTMQMPTQEEATFSLTSVYVPAGSGDSQRAAMAGFLAVDSETGNTPGKVREDYGKLRLMALPSSTTVPGPGQVQNAFNSNQQIAQELNLLNQQGSNVIRGNLLTLPVGGGLLYVQPVYVQSTGSTAYPVLRYVLTSFGDQVGFARTLEDSLDQTFGGDSSATVTDPGEGTTDPGDEGGPELDLTTQMTNALAAAQTAMVASQQAMQAGDWAAYGQAQDALDAALAQAIAIQEQLDAASGATLSGGAQSGDGAADFTE